MFVKNRAWRRAFTLIELLVVIVVIAVLAAIILPKFANQGKRSKEATLKSNLRLLRSAVSTFQTDTGAFPATLAALSATSAPASGLDTGGSSATITAADWRGPYIDGTIPNDPVSGAAFTYSVASPTVGKVSSSATGNDSTGVAFSTY